MGAVWHVWKARMGWGQEGWVHRFPQSIAPGLQPALA